MRSPRQPGDLSDLLLLDVEAGLREQASRIEEAITAVQAFIRRSRLGLEPGWKVTSEFARLWDSRFETYRTWERARAPGTVPGELDRVGRADASPPHRGLPVPGVAAARLDPDPGRARRPGLVAGRRPGPGAARPSCCSGGCRPSSARCLRHCRRQPPARALDPAPAHPRTRPTDLARPSGRHAGSADGWRSPAVPQAQARSRRPRQPVDAPGRARPRRAARQPESLPLWMESAIKLGTRFVRVAAAGVPQAALGFAPHGAGSPGACCRECGREHPAGVDEYYFWLIDAQVYSYTDDTSTSGDGDASFTGSYSSASRTPTTTSSSSSRPNGTTKTWCRRCWPSGSRARPSGSPGAACTTASSGSPAVPQEYVASQPSCPISGSSAEPGTRCTSRSPAALRCHPATVPMTTKRTERRPVTARFPVRPRRLTGGRSCRKSSTAGAGHRQSGWPLRHLPGRAAPRTRSSPTTSPAPASSRRPGSRPR